MNYSIGFQGVPMAIQKKLVLLLLSFSYWQMTPVLSMEDQNSVALTNESLNILESKDQEQIEKLTSQTEQNSKDSLSFLSTGPKKQIYSQQLLFCLNKENETIEKIEISRNLGTLTFTTFFPLLPNYHALRTLDISTNNITDKMLSKHKECFCHLNHIEILLMGSNKITEKSISLMMDIINSPEMNISHLGLQKNKIAEKSAMDVLFGLESIKIKQLDLSDQKNEKGKISQEEYEETISALKAKFPDLTCHLRKTDIHILSTPDLSLHCLIVTSLTNETSESTSHTPEERDGYALKLPNSPIKRTFPKSKWNGRFSQCIMAIDPSGSGTDATGYAVIRVNQSHDYLITKAGGIEGDGLADTTFETLRKIAEIENVETIAIEDNYHQGAYLVAFKQYCLFQQLLKLVSEGKKSINYADELGLKFTLVNHRTTEKDKGERIINTLKPLLEAGKLFVEESFFYEDWRHRDKAPSLLHQLSLIKPFFKSQTTKNGDHDDIPDALEIAIKFHQKNLAVSNTMTSISYSENETITF